MPSDSRKAVASEGRESDRAGASVASGPRTGRSPPSVTVAGDLGAPRPPDPGPSPFALVVIAASAGGLAALSAVLTAIPADFAGAVLAVQHLDPRHKSVIDQILSRRTPLEVSLATEGARILPGRVMVAPPDRHLVVNADATVSLSDDPLVHFVRPSADRLFESAAAIFGERAIAVVLSGSGSDGDGGVRAVKRGGGTVIAQDQQTSQFFGMPGAAIGTGVVDLVLPLPDIAPALISLVGLRR